MIQPKNRSGFSLVELLVAITIIVVLLALLTPALDQAIYQAELAVCGSNLHNIGSGLNTYAVDYKRHYPHRAGVNNESDNGPTRPFAWVSSWRDASLVNLLPPPYDDRRALRGYLSLNGHLNCPLNKKLDIEGSRSNTECPYQLWYGFQFRQDNAGVPEPGMLKIGDLMRFTNPQTGRVSRHDLLASDMDDINIPSTSFCFGTHPDKEGVLAQLFQQDTDFGTDAEMTIAAADPGAGNAGRFTISRWQMTGGKPYRGALDRSFAHGDGSVSRITDITLDDALQARRGLAKVPIFSNNGGFNDTAGQFTTLPTR